MTSDELWIRATADRYDTEEGEMSSAAVLGPTLAFLADLAGDGRALEFAIGTGRVSVPLRERGVPVVGVEVSEHMAAALRRKIGGCCGCTGRVPCTVRTGPWRT